MSDSFSDLWASALPKQPQQLPLKSLVAGANNSSSSNISGPDGARRANADSFSILASAGSSRSNSRPITPSAKPLPPPSNLGAGDAFGGLVSFGAAAAATAPRDDHLTIAERAAKAERERLENVYDNRGAALQPQNAGSFWDQFEGPSKPKSEPKATWDFDVLVPEPTQPSSDKRAPAPAVSNGSTEWDLDFIPSAPTVSIVPPTAQPIRDIFDIDDLAALEQVRPKESELADSFDFDGHADETLPIAREEETDDILGSLARPVEEVRRLSSKAPSPVPAQAPKSSASPPPHVVGRIVEMGFSLQRAKIALAATDSGVDVDAALEILLQNVEQDPEREREQQEDTMSEEAEVDPEWKPPPRRTGLSSTGIVASGSSSQRPSPSPSLQPGLQDKLLAQASTIGLNMFNRANAMWKEGRDKVVKVYEEQKAANAGTDAAKTSGRPKWMDETARFDDLAESSADASQTRPSLAAARSQPVAPTQRKFLFVEETQQAYKSPARRRPPSSSPSSPPPPSVPPPHSSKPPSRPRTPPMTRPTIPVSHSALATSDAHKEAGNTHFKLGRFAEAEVSYSSALAALPPSHVLRVTLHNNRALTRLRTGDYKGTVDDAGEVQRIVEGDAGRSWHPGREVNGAVIDGVDLGVALEKSLRRRAEANEGMERWREAGRDWERLSAAGWMGAAIREEAIKSAGRCRRMLNGPPPESTRPPTTTSSKRRVPVVAAAAAAAAAAATRPPSEALSRVRAANAAQDAEDQSRHEFKDSVDARLSAWRTGKETNLRGLIASLDMVLWPELGWQKVGMAELVSSAQVKARYMKAIAKVHPDKLNVTNTTVEQRMIANGVFGTLNEAWNAFR